MAYDLRSHKIVGIVSDKEPPHVTLNVLGHLGIALGALVERERIMGRPTLVDGSGVAHPGIARYSFVIKVARPTKLYEAIARARTTPDVVVVDYPRAMLETGHDDELAAAIASQAEVDLGYLGAVLFGPTEAIDALSGKMSLYRSPTT